MLVWYQYNNNNINNKKCMCKWEPENICSKWTWMTQLFYKLFEIICECKFVKLKKKLCYTQGKILYEKRVTSQNSQNLKFKHQHHYS